MEILARIQISRGPALFKRGWRNIKSNCPWCYDGRSKKQSLSGTKTARWYPNRGTNKDCRKPEPVDRWLYSYGIKQRSQGLKTQPCGSGWRWAQESQTCELCSGSISTESITSLWFIVFIILFYYLFHV